MIGWAKSMTVFLKYIFRSMKEHKAQLLLLILSITVSSALLFGILGWSDSFSKTLTKTYTSYYEDAEFYISSKNENPFFDLTNIKMEGFKDEIPEIRYSAVRYNGDDAISVNFIARESKYNEFKLCNGDSVDVDKDSCIISKRCAEAYKYEIGSTIEFKINGEYKNLTISAIALNEGPFIRDTKVEYSVITSYEYLENELSADGKYNFVRVKCAEDDKDAAVSAFNSANEDVQIDELYSKSLVDNEISNTTRSYYIMLIFVVLICIVIIASGKKLDIAERLPSIGTFYSVGATKAKVEMILYLESIIEGLIGGILGIIFGYILVAYMNYSTSEQGEFDLLSGTQASVLSYFVIIVFAVVISMLGSELSLKSIRKLQTKEIILNSSKTENVQKHIAEYIGIILLLFGCLMTYINVNESAIRLSVISVLFMLIGVCLAAPLLVRSVASLFLILTHKHGGTNFIFHNNLKTSKIITTNVRLMLVASISILTIFFISDSVQSSINEIIEGLDYSVKVYDIEDAVKSDNEFSIDNFLNDIYSVEGVEEENVICEYSSNGYVDRKNAYFFGIDTDKYPQYNRYIKLESSEKKEVYDKYAEDTDKYIWMSKESSRKYGVSADDSVKVKINGLEKEYILAGVINTRVYNMGAGVFIDKNQMKENFHMNYPSAIFIKSDDLNQKQLKNALKERLTDYGVRVETKDVLMEADIEQNRALITNLKLFGMICIIVGLVGVINNLIMSFIQRKREFAVLTSIGMEGRMRRRVLILESIAISVWSILISLPFMMFFVKTCSNLTRFVGFGLDVSINQWVMLGYSSIVILASIISIIPLSLRSRKLSVIQEIRYE